MSGKRYQGLEKLLKKKKFVVFSPDLPGFGTERLQKKAMTLDDYVSFVKTYMKRHEIKKALFIGHSFGGRIAAKLAISDPKLVDRLILTGSPLVKQKLSVKKRAVSIVAFFGKIILWFFPTFVQQLFRKLAYVLIGEFDYFQAGELRDTFKKIIAEDLSLLLPRIHVPTVVVWGEDDHFVPVSVGVDIAHLIKGAKLLIVPDATHKLPYENPKLFVKAISPFLS